MAFIDSGSYDGKYNSSEIYSDCIFGSETLAQEAVSFFLATKKSQKIPIMNIGSVLIADSCAWTPSGDITLTDKEITVCKFKINFQACVQDLETTYMSEKMQSGALNSNFPATELDQVLNLVSSKAKEDYEKVIWQGDTLSIDPVLSLCDGFIKLLAADPLTIPVVAVPLTAANIVAEMTKVYDVIDDCIMDKPDLKYYMPINTKKMLRQAMAQSPSQVNNLGIGLVGNDNFDFFGIPIVFTHGIPNNTMIATLKSNLWLGMDLTGDIDELKVLNFSDTQGSDVIAVKGRFFGGCQIYSGKYAVLYS